MTLRLVGLVFVAMSACRSDSVGPGGEPTPVVPPLAVPADLPDDLGTKAFEHVRATVAFGARHSGTSGWQRSVDYIAASLVDLGLEVERDRWTDPTEGLTFENVVAVIPGTRPDRIVLGCHHDTKITSGHADPEHNFDFVGANDPGSAVGLLLALAEHFAKAPPPPATLELVFFDGEESLPFDWDPSRALFGSKRFVAEATRRIESGAAAPIRAMILLDMVGAADLTIDEETWSTAELKDLVMRAARALGHERYFFANELRVRDDHLPFLEAGIPAVDLIDLADNPQWHTKDDTIEHLRASSMQIVGEVVLTMLPAVCDLYLPSRDR